MSSTVGSTSGRYTAPASHPGNDFSTLGALLDFIDFEQLALVHLLATGFMVGLIWTIHAVHYPLFAFVPEPYEPFQSEHMRRITLLLLVPWGAEVFSALGLVLLADDGTQRTLAFIGGALVVAIVAVTGLLAAPAHGRLLQRFDADEHRSLMRIDLIRTLLWTLRGAVALAIAWSVID